MFDESAIFWAPGPSSAWAGFLGTRAQANVLIIEA